MPTTKTAGRVNVPSPGRQAGGSPFDAKSILRSVGLAVRRDANGVARPAAVCAWCDAETGAVRGPGTSHGICEHHKEQLLREVAA